MRETQPLLADLSLLGETDVQTGCLILSDSAKSYREESTGCSGNQDRAHQGAFPRGGIALSMKGDGGHYPGERDSSLQTEEQVERLGNGKALNI